MTYCLQFLLILVTYPVPPSAQNPGSDKMPANEIRRALGRLHRAEHFQHLVEGLKQILMQPVRPSTPAYHRRAQYTDLMAAHKGARHNPPATALVDERGAYICRDSKPFLGVIAVQQALSQLLD